jgi:anaerobic magnesium-protoporphyrin IX monomethyl ester cyclase
MNPILLINPSDRKSIYQGLADEFSAIEPPLWCRLIGSYLNGKNIPVHILDTQLIVGSDTDIAKIIVDDIKPSICVLVVYGQQPSASTQTMPAAISLCDEINLASECRMPLVVLGTHPAALPERTLEECECDFVCTGEGFESLVHLYRLIEKWSDLWKWHIAPDCPQGMCYWDHGKPVFTNPAPLVWNMDEISGRLWKELPGIKKGQYRSHNWQNFGQPESDRNHYASIYTSLGCPYSCSFCTIQSPFREGDELKFKGRANSYRMWSPAHVADEIQCLVDRGVCNIKIADEMFLLNRSHVEGICAELEKRKITDRRINMWFYSRVDTVGTDFKLLERMRRCGFQWAALGIESANEKSLESVDKRDYSNDQVTRSVRALQQAGMSVIGNYIFGLPSDSQRSISETYELACDLNTEFINLYSAVAFPGSKLFSDLTAKGWKPPAWSAYSFHSYDHDPLPTDTLTSAEVLRLRDGAFQKYMRSEKYLTMIGDKFGPDAVQNVKRMTAVPLKRQLLGD